MVAPWKPISPLGSPKAGLVVDFDFRSFGHCFDMVAHISEGRCAKALGVFFQGFGTICWMIVGCVLNVCYVFVYICIYEYMCLYTCRDKGARKQSKANILRKMIEQGVFGGS